jgi:hypothetical protein
VPNWPEAGMVSLRRLTVDLDSETLQKKSGRQDLNSVLQMLHLSAPRPEKPASTLSSVSRASKLMLEIKMLGTR